jgi:hypothetical protein
MFRIGEFAQIAQVSGQKRRAPNSLASTASSFPKRKAREMWGVIALVFPALYFGWPL